MSGSISGYVVQDGRPVADATVTVLAGSGPYPDLAALTDNDGWFTFDGLETGQWVLRAYGENGSFGDAVTPVFDHSMSDVTIQLPSMCGPDIGTSGESPDQLQ